MSKPQRITAEQMSQLAHEHPGAEIEMTDAGLAFLRIGRVEYVATIAETEAAR